MVTGISCSSVLTIYIVISSLWNICYAAGEKKSMKKAFFVLLVVASVALGNDTIVVQEDIFIKPKKKESVAKLKEQLALEFDMLIKEVTSSIRQLSMLIDDAALGVKQLVGEQQGILMTSDKKVLQSYQERINDLRQMLGDLQNKCTLDVNK